MLGNFLAIHWTIEHSGRAATVRYLLFSDEAWFYPSGYITTQNYHVWLAQNPCEFAETFLHLIKIDVWWCRLVCWYHSSSFFSETITVEKYQEITENFALLEAHECDAWFQQDNARPYVAEEILTFLREFFHNCLITQSLWPANSLKLSPLNHFLWGYLKDKIYANGPVSLIETLKSRITQYIKQINRKMLKKVFANPWNGLAPAKRLMANIFNIFPVNIRTTFYFFLQFLCNHFRLFWSTLYITLIFRSCAQSEPISDNMLQ